MSLVKIQEFFDHKLDVFSKYFFYIILFTHICYFYLFIGLISIDPNYIRGLSGFVQLLVSLFLIVRFHPYRHHVFKDGDAQIIFGSGMLLLINLGATEFVIQFYENIKEKLKTWSMPKKDKPNEE
jgi:hypothetical protein